MRGGGLSNDVIISSPSMREIDNIRSFYKLSLKIYSGPMRRVARLLETKIKHILDGHCLCIYSSQI